MSNNTFGLNGLEFDVSAVTRPIGKLMLSGTIGTDLIIPEDISDSEAILRNDCMLKISGISAENNTVTVTGTVYYTTLLLGEDGTLGSVKASDDFELKDFIEGADGDIALVFAGSSVKCNSRLINPRKINLSSEISVSVYAMCEQNAVPAIKGTESIDDECSLKRRKGTVNCADTYSLSEKDISVSHDVMLDGNLPPISEIVYYSVKIDPTELMTAGNNILVKSKAVFSAIYKSEEGNIFALQKSFVLEKSIDADNAEAYEWFANTYTSDLVAEIAIDSYGEAKIIEIDFTYDILLNGVRNIEVETVTDAYSTDYDCDTSTLFGESIVYKRAYGTSLSVNAFAERNEISAQNVRNVMLGNVTVKDLWSEYSEDKRRLNIEATAVITAVCENNITAESEAKFSSVSFEYPFKCELEAGDVLDNTNYHVIISVTDSRFRCDQNKIFCDFENNVRAVVSETVPHTYLTDIVINKNSPVPEPYAPITLCYPSGGETLWDIAKYYKVPSEGIILSNGLEDEDISEKKVLIIPSMKNSKLSHSKVN